MSSLSNVYPNHLLSLAILQLISLPPKQTHSRPTNSQPATHFTAVRSNPLQTLSQVTSAYIQLLGIKCKELAELAGREDVVLQDFAVSLDEVTGGRAGSSVEDLKDWLKDRREKEDWTATQEAEERLKELGKEMQDYLGPLPSTSQHTHYQFVPISTKQMSKLSQIDLASLPEQTPSPISISTSSSSERTDDTMDGSRGKKRKRESSVDSGFEEDMTGEGDEAGGKDKGKGKEVEEREEEREREAEPQQDTIVDGDGSRTGIPFLPSRSPSPTSWKDPTIKPSFVPSFLPPFPGQERLPTPPPFSASLVSPDGFTLPTPSTSRPLISHRKSTVPAVAAVNSLRRLDEGDEDHDEADIGEKKEGEIPDPRNLPDYEIFREKVPFEISTLKENHPDMGSKLREFKKRSEEIELVKDSRKQRDSNSPNPQQQKVNSSLPYFLETFSYISTDSSLYSLPSYNRVNPKRRKWIPLLQNTLDSNGDSLYGSIPIHSAGASGMKRSREGTGWINEEAWRRKGKEGKGKKDGGKKDKKGKGKSKEKGLEDEELEEDLEEVGAIDSRPSGYTSSSSKDPIPVLHPVHGKLPYTVSMPVPPNPSAPHPPLTHSTLNSRIPMLIPSLSAKMSHLVAIQSVQGVQHPGSGVWSKLRRIGPPSQLDLGGSMREYEFDLSTDSSTGGAIKYLCYGFDWPAPEPEVELSEIISKKKAPTTSAMPVLKEREAEEREKEMDWSAKEEERRLVPFPGLGKEVGGEGGKKKGGKIKVKREDSGGVSGQEVDCLQVQKDVAMMI